jgi:radical SAM superfamily enzyme YgiQ (UPF0313 family)
MKLLLTSVFGPYGVDDEYGRKENVMEVMHNQVTREQGVFSLRFNQETYAFHLMAENLKIPTVVLDFPTLKRFISEIKKGYDYVGISFIATNFLKAQRMAQLIRKYSPDTKIIIAGHGTAIDHIERKIPCDYVCRGDGVQFMRELFNQDPEAPITHPIRHFCFNRYILGAPIGHNMIAHGIILPGVGCVNGCRFCCTSHFFQKKYTAFLHTGKDLFDLCRQYEDKMGITDFYVQDENFFKNETRARDLLALMEKHRKPYTFNIFSSAETLIKMGPEFIQRIGIEFLWVGVESKKEMYGKNRNVDFHVLIKQLRDLGVNVLISGILFLEEHTKENIHDDIDFLVDLNADFLQFMQLGPLPGTSLYYDYKNKNLLLEDVPLEEWHGQDRIWYRHPHFTPEESSLYIKNAFKKDFDLNGPSLLRTADSTLRGAINTQNADNTGDEFMKLRHLKRKKRAMAYYPMLDSLVTHAHNDKVKSYAKEVRERYRTFFKKIPLKVRLLSAGIQLTMIKEIIRSKLIQNNMRQPQTRLTRYRMD